jgi:hypothetical protein
LLQLDAEGPADDKLGRLAVRSIGGDEEVAVAASETCRDIAVAKLDIAEIDEDGRRIGGLHREIVMRAAPEPRLRRVTAGADVATDKTRRRDLGRDRGGARVPTTAGYPQYGGQPRPSGSAAGAGMHFGLC